MQAKASKTSRMEGSELDNATLLSRLCVLVARDRTTTAKLLWHLAEVDVRGLYRDEGYSSLFEYCVKALHMSEGEASLRIRAARLSRRFPVVLEKVERGELHLSALRALAPVLTEDNHGALLAVATHKTRREVEQMLADRAPRPDVMSEVRKLPSAKRTGPSQNAVTRSLFSTGPCAPEGTSSEEVSAPAQPAPSGATVQRPQRRAATTPLGAERYKVQFTADQPLHDQIRQAQDLLRHQVPDGDLATIMGKAMTLLVDKLKKQRFGHTNRPRGDKARAKNAPGAKSAKPAKPAKPSDQQAPDQVARSTVPSQPSDQGSEAGNRHIPAEVRRTVVERDGARCTFVSDSGRRCDATGMLEFHHDDPFAKGGPPIVTNIRLMCRSHNALLAEKDFGRDFILQRRKGTGPATGHARKPTVPGPSQG